jgi:acetate kinase
MEGEKKLAWGLVECIGLEESFYTHQTENTEKKKDTLKISTHTDALQIILHDLLDKKAGIISDVKEIAVVGHRVVHGGDKFCQPVFVDEQVKTVLRECFDIAPLHNPSNYEGIIAVERMLPNVPSVLVFDTAFHQTMPDYAYIYALPYEYYQKHHIRRYGFHGTSHEYVARKAAGMLGKPFNELKIITMHLGNGSSVAAINMGKVVDTSMGFTPLEGLIMGSRSGDIDPAIIPFLMEKYPDMGHAAINDMLNKKSGLLALSGISADMRSIVEAKEKGYKRAILAFEALCYSIKKYIGAYFAALNGIDVLVFTAGIGENSAPVRASSTKGLEALGINIDEHANTVKSDKERVISADFSKVKVLVVPTNEELMIARQAEELLKMKEAGKEEAKEKL